MCRRRQQNGKHNDMPQAGEEELPRQESREMHWRDNAAFTLDFNYQNMGDAAHNPIYDSAYLSNSPPNLKSGIQNPTHGEILTSEGTTSSSHSNHKEKRNFTNRLFQDDSKTSVKVDLSGENIHDEAV